MMLVYYSTPVIAKYLEEMCLMILSNLVHDVSCLDHPCYSDIEHGGQLITNLAKIPSWIFVCTSLRFKMLVSNWLWPTRQADLSVVVIKMESPEQAKMDRPDSFIIYRQHAFFLYLLSWDCEISWRIFYIIVNQFIKCCIKKWQLL